MGADVVVVGAGIVGAACAYALTARGLSVTVVDRGSVAGGTTGAGEGNILVSDKEPGPELALARRSAARWQELAGELGPDIEYEAKGGVVVADDETGLGALRTLAAAQRAAGVDAEQIDDLAGVEPHLNPELAGGVFYPQDAQVQPMKAAARLLAAARSRGATLELGRTVSAVASVGGKVTAVATDAGSIACEWVVNAAGTWAGELSRRCGLPLPIEPRRGFVLVTAPAPPLVRHKVYSASYVADVAAGSAALQTSAVVEGTPSGTILIGASRERVGFDRSLSVPVVQALAAQAVALFPVLAGIDLLRVYRGFRPYCPDHLPAIGPDPRLPGVVHACGHEGAGIGLAPATGDIVADVITGGRAPAEFAVDRLIT